MALSITSSLLAAPSALAFALYKAIYSTTIAMAAILRLIWFRFVREKRLYRIGSSSSSSSSRNRCSRYTCRYRFRHTGGMSHGNHSSTALRHLHFRPVCRYRDGRTKTGLRFRIGSGRYFLFGGKHGRATGLLRLLTDNTRPNHPFTILRNACFTIRTSRWRRRHGGTGG
uniref:Putative secreted peptide n=1 Tax=Anopheles braziliensis TaxID=58242 RepID=A0A2M3ZN49_9DIPT